MGTRSDYRSTAPLDEHEVLEELKAIHQKKAGHEAEAEGRKKAYDEVREKVAFCDKQINDVLRALNEDRFVYRLKTGDVTLAPPDNQMTIDEAVESFVGGDGLAGEIVVEKPKRSRKKPKRSRKK